MKAGISGASLFLGAAPPFHICLIRARLSHAIKGRHAPWADLGLPFPYIKGENWIALGNQNELRVESLEKEFGRSSSLYIGYQMDRTDDVIAEKSLKNFQNIFIGAIPSPYHQRFPGMKQPVFAE